MNPLDAETLIEADQAIGLYATPLLSPVGELASKLERTVKVNLKGRSVPRVPIYLRDVSCAQVQSLPNKKYTPAMMYISSLPESLERPSYQFLDVVMGQIYRKIQKRKVPPSPFKVKNKMASTRNSITFTARRKSPETTKFLTEQPVPTRFSRYKSYFCDQNIPKIRISTSPKDRREEMRKFGKTSTIFNRTRFTITGALGVPSSIMDSPQQNRKEQNTSLQQLRTLNTPINPMGGRAQTATKNEMLDFSNFNSTQHQNIITPTSKSNERKKYQSRKQKELFSGESHKASHKEIVGESQSFTSSQKLERLSEVLRSSNEQSILSLIRKERNQKKNIEENILIEPAKMFKQKVEERSRQPSPPPLPLSKLNKEAKTVFRLKRIEQRFNNARPQTQFQLIKEKQTANLNESLKFANQTKDLAPISRFERGESPSRRNQERTKNISYILQKTQKRPKTESLIKHIRSRAEQFIKLQRRGSLKVGMEDD